MRHSLLTSLTMLAALAGLGACASTATPAQRPIPEAPEFASASPDPSDAIATDPGDTPIVIASNTDGIGAAWASVTQNAMAGTLAELSNLGGAPVVLGTVGAVMALDAAPKGRAARTARAINAGVDPAELDAALAAALENELDDFDAPVTVMPIERTRDLPEDAYVVTTEYTLASDGSAIRVRSDVRHTDLLRFIAAVNESEQRLQSAREGFGSYDPRRERRRVEKARKRYLARPRFAGSFIYHSDPIALPDTGELPEEELQMRMRERLVSALETERAAQRQRADDRYAADVAAKPEREARAAKRRDKAYAKADSLYAKSLEKAGDDEFGKMERMVLGMEKWLDSSEGASLIAQTLDDAQAFMVASIADGLENGAITEAIAAPDALVAGEPVETLATLDDGRAIVRVVEGQQRGMVMSVPESGAADYGGAVARAK